MVGLALQGFATDYAVKKVKKDLDESDDDLGLAMECRMRSRSAISPNISYVFSIYPPAPRRMASHPSALINGILSKFRGVVSKF